MGGPSSLPSGTRQSDHLVIEHAAPIDIGGQSQALWPDLLRRAKIAQIADFFFEEAG